MGSRASAVVIIVGSWRIQLPNLVICVQLCVSIVIIGVTACQIWHAVLIIMYTGMNASRTTFVGRGRLGWGRWGRGGGQGGLPSSKETCPCSQKGTHDKHILRDGVDSTIIKRSTHRPPVLTPNFTDMPHWSGMSNIGEGSLHNMKATVIVIDGVHMDHYIFAVVWSRTSAQPTAVTSSLDHPCSSDDTGSDS